MTGVLSYLNGLLSLDQSRCGALNFKGRSTYVLFTKQLLQLVGKVYIFLNEVIPFCIDINIFN